MGKFRKKLVVIEAEHFTMENKNRVHMFVTCSCYARFDEKDARITALESNKCSCDVEVNHICLVCRYEKLESENKDLREQLDAVDENAWDDLKEEISALRKNLETAPREPVSIKSCLVKPTTKLWLNQPTNKEVVNEKG